MKFDAIKPLSTMSTMNTSNIKPIGTSIGQEMTSPKENVESFGNIFSNAFSNANKALYYAGQSARVLAKGGDIEMHEVSVAGQKAKIALHLTTQITTKITQACSQIFQMQI